MRQLPVHKNNWCHFAHLWLGIAELICNNKAQCTINFRAEDTDEFAGTESKGIVMSRSSAILAS